MISLTGRSPNLACREFVALVLSLIAIGMLDGRLEAKKYDDVERAVLSRLPQSSQPRPSALPLYT